MPERIQLRRTKGWRKPADAIVVARPSKWGNPFRVGDVATARFESGSERELTLDAPTCVALYRGALETGQLPITIGDVRRELAGRDLACWCAPSAQCHADVLLEIANGPRP